jgi:ABC-type polysaccharide/polyol phosphate transport system ATPase subunit
MIDLKFDRVSKRYRIQQESGGDNAARHPALRKLMSLRASKKDFWAVRDVSFEVERGEALGIIGHNGAGKSTILKLLSNITTPTSGEITINGRLSALIEVGSGFHPELTGRENVYLNGSILGMSRREISKKMESIIEFAGISQFADTPVKRFSSGMYVRLGFSIAAHLEPDILLLDEVLAVGDATFQAKCLQRIGELKNEGVTIVFISHDLAAVERLCDRVLLMKSGQIAASGPAREVIDKYQSAAELSKGSKSSATLAGTNAAEILALSFCDEEGQTRPVFKTGEPLMARIEFEAHAPVNDAVFDIFFHSPGGESRCEFTTEVSGERLSLSPGRGAIEFFCPELGLLPGIYYTDVAVKERGGVESIHFQGQSTMLRVDIGKVVRGDFYLPHQWCLRQTEGLGETSVVSFRGN